MYPQIVTNNPQKLEFVLWTEIGGIKHDICFLRRRICNEMNNGMYVFNQLKQTNKQMCKKEKKIKTKRKTKQKIFCSVNKLLPINKNPYNYVVNGFLRMKNLGQTLLMDFFSLLLICTYSFTLLLSCCRMMNFCRCFTLLLWSQLQSSIG